ncbi:protein unc-93 homolog A-like [Argiope bruennichi]|uniref:protein unc-93 homolog A-like n=1 Tax=Argiope bruennichi TaxID=94029 RepID=UPI00249440EA|nr:protein unc-93 homolog A-like [Argiope bruennichi]
MAIDQASEKRPPKLTKLRIIKNLILISISFFLLFTAYDGLSMLQSTMNKKAGVGVVSQAVGYISFCISALLLPKYVIRKIGCKSSLIMAIGFYVPCIAANFYPKWYVMIPTGVLAGIGASILWGSQCTYFNESAFRYSRLIDGESRSINQSPDNVSNRTSTEILSERNSKCEITEENSMKVDVSIEEKSKETTAESSVVRFECKNHGCGNVDEFVVSEIEKNCVQFIGKTAENNLTPKEERNSDDFESFSPTDISHSPIKTNKSETGIKADDRPEGLTVSKEEDIIKSDVIDVIESTTVLPKRNPERQPIFQRANTLESVTGLFFGCHGIAFYSAQICSNVISYYVLKGDNAPGMSHFGGCSCGAHFCNDNKWCINDDTEYVSPKIRYLLSGISVVIASIGVLLVFLFVDPLKKAKDEDEPETISLRLVSATISQNKKKEQLCLIPIAFFEGMQQGFYTADFTKSYVGCAWGASNVGLVSMFYGSACVFSSSTTGFLVKYVGRKPLFLIAQVISLSMMIFLMLWEPNSDSTYKFYIAAIFFGTLTGIYWSQLLAFHGLLFKKDEEAAFASYYLWSSLGWTTSFLYSDHLCTYIKIYILLTVSLIGTTGYLFTERSYQLKKKQAAVETIKKSDHSYL